LYTIYEVLNNHKCKTCGNLTYWDWYMCKLGKHTTSKGFLHMGKLKECDEYITREGHNNDNRKGKECVFWCLECSNYKKEK
jgi:hypothetical protein